MLQKGKSLDRFEGWPSRRGKKVGIILGGRKAAGLLHFWVTVIKKRKKESR